MRNAYMSVWNKMCLINLYQNVLKNNYGISAKKTSDNLAYRLTIFRKKKFLFFKYKEYLPFQYVASARGITKYSIRYA